MNILLIIIGGILFLGCGFISFCMHLAIKNKTNWDEFYKLCKEKDSSFSEERGYRLVCKIKFFSSLFMVIGLLMMAWGISLQILK